MDQPHETPEENIEPADFQRLRMRVGTVLACRPNAAARVPAYVLEVDFGPLGRRTSSAQLAGNYRPEELVGRQVVAVVNLPPRRVAGVKSEVLVLGGVSDENDVVLLAPDERVEDGTPVG